MIKYNRIASALFAFALLASSSAVSQIVFDGTPGVSAPPSTLGPFTMAPFGADPGPLFVDVTTAPGPNGDVVFSTGVNHRKVGSGWATWSHGYAGDVYFATGTQLVMTMPANTQAFYFYAEPNSLSTYTITATSQDNTSSGPIPVVGNAGAKYFGFFSTNGVGLATITVDVPAAASGFAVGEFGIFQCEAPGIAVSLSPSMLWPPNHTMANISASVTVTGNCGGEIVTLESVSSNEPDNGDDDGNTVDDIQGVTLGVADYQFKVRRERSGIGTGRVYTATYKVTDQYGNWSTGFGTVTVPLNMSKTGPVASAPAMIELEQNYPNPFNPSTTIRYGVPVDGHVKLAVYDMMGREVSVLSDEAHQAGTYSVAFDAADQPSGMYIYRLTMDGVSTYRTMTLSK